MLCLLVSIRFQVLFHSPPGVLFTVPSRYYTLSVTWSYLALRDGPRLFRQDSSCPAVLRILPPLKQFRLRGFYPLPPRFPTLFDYRFRWISESFTPTVLLQSVWALPISLATTFGIVFYFLFLRVIRCFSSPGSLRYTYLFSIRYRNITYGEFPHSDICGSRLICSSPQLFAACHVLLRRHVPRHPPVCSL